MRALLLAASALFMATAAVAAGSALSIQRSVFVEKSGEGGVELARAERLRTGDKVVLVMRWDETDAAAPFTLNSRVPQTLAYQRSNDDTVLVSADGGRNWGRIGSLKSGERLVAPEEVTNLRWRISRDDPHGMRSFKAIVR